MKHTKILALLIALLLIVGGCKKTDKPDGADTNNPPVESEIPSSAPDDAADFPDEEPTVYQAEVLGPATIIAQLATEEMLNSYAPYSEFDEYSGTSDYGKILFTTNKTVQDFQFIAISYTPDGKMEFSVDEVLFELSEFGPEAPLAVTWLDAGTIPNRGFCYREANEIHYHTLTISGQDGSLLYNSYTTKIID